MLLCFIALFIQLNNIQIFKTNSLANDPNNPQVFAAEHDQPRGATLSADGVTLASSVPSQGIGESYPTIWEKRVAVYGS